MTETNKQKLVKAQSKSIVSKGPEPRPFVMILPLGICLGDPWDRHQVSQPQHALPENALPEDNVQCPVLIPHL